MIVFDRFRNEFVAAGFADYLPDGVRWDGLTREVQDSQLDISGYDRDEYVELDLIHPNFDHRDDRTRRSHRTSRVRQRALRKIAFSFANASSIGLRSGLYFGRNQSCAPTASIACRTAGLL